MDQQGVLICTAPHGLIEQFYEVELQNELGSGNFATVYKGRNLVTNLEVAVKKIVKSKVENKRRLKSEVTILAAMHHHPKIVSMYAVFDTDKYLYLVLELMSEVDLFDEIIERQTLTEREASDVIKQVFQAIAHMHKHNVVHRDIKLENLLLKTAGDLTNIKVTDFGLSKDIGLSDARSAVGTPFYVAPDIILASENCSIYGPEVDMWAMGVLLFIILSGRLPFTSEKDEDELFDTILEAKIIWKSPQFDNVSEDAKDLISKLLKAQPTERLTAEQALEHPFIVSNSNKQPLIDLGPNLTKNYKRQGSKKNKGRSKSSIS